MSSNIYEAKFLSLRKPAWHHLGEVVNEPLGARAAFDRIGPYDVKLEGMITTEGVPVLDRAIVRQAAHGKSAVVFGTVGPEYELITPRDMCFMWDEYVYKPVETMGALGEGETFFISTKMPSFSIKGDDVDNYFLSVSPMNGKRAAILRVTPVRVVCSNTLIASASSAVETYKINHSEGAKQRLAEWMHHVYSSAEKRAERLRSELTIMAETPMTEEAADAILNRAYPIVSRPNNNAPEEIMRKRLEWWEKNRKYTLEHRVSVPSLFGGAGTGMDVVATKGTCYGLYQAVTESENYRKGASDVQVSVDVMFGKRADTMERAYESIMDYIHDSRGGQAQPARNTASLV